MKRKFFSAAVGALLTVCVTGCGSFPIALTALVPVFVSGAGGGVAYTITNIAYKTFNYPVKDVEAALEEALQNMEIKEENRRDVEDGVKIVGVTRKLRIHIRLEVITPKTTRIRVDAKKMYLLKDKATATEIIIQTGKILEDERPPGITRKKDTF